MWCRSSGSWPPEDICPSNVIVHLGTNGAIDGADCDRWCGWPGRDRRIFLVTVKVPRPYRDPNNARLSACAHRHDNVSIIDWYALSRYHTGVVLQRRVPPATGRPARVRGAPRSERLRRRLAPRPSETAR